jgi:BA14K-like protein
MKYETFIRLAVGTCLSFSLATPSHANVADYCAAYARDFANHVDKQNPQWQHRYDNAEASCVLRFTSDEKPVPNVKPKARKVTAKKPVAPVVTTAPEPKPEPEAAPPQVAKAVPKLLPGSPEWTDYCKKKYVSFNEATGTYMSKTGIERKCLVNAE